ncbi:MAG: hypothetical protein KIT24_06055 [Phycisphaeraceae bacterium]|nr:hypothetical protein [Phycisphaeraceae bacterium]
MMHVRALGSGLLVSLASGHALAQETQMVVRYDDFFPPDRVVTSLDSVTVNNHGSWVVQARAPAGVFLIRDGAVVAVAGQSVPAPPGGVIGFFSGARLNNHGDIGHRLSLDNVPTSGDSGIYFNLSLVIQKGQFSIAPQFSSSTRWLGFFNATRMNDLNQIFIMGSVDDPLIPTSVDRALVRVDYDAAVGLYLETAIAWESQIIDGQAVVDLGTNPNQLSVSPNGRVMYFVDGDAPTFEDGMLMVDDQMVAREGRPSLVPGLNYTLLASRAHAVNDAGVWAARVQLGPADISEDDFILRSDGAVIAREGMTAPGIPDARITGFGSGPLWISDRGEVLWIGRLDTGDAVLYIGNQVLLQTGDLVEGLLITRLYDLQEGYALSSNGRFAIVRVEYFDPAFGPGRQAAVLIDRGDFACIADLSGSSDPNDPAYGVPDGNVDLSDFFYFLDQFVAGNLAVADLTTTSDPNDPGYGIPDGVLDISDFFYYLDRFVEGCP